MRYIFHTTYDFIIIIVVFISVSTKLQAQYDINNVKNQGKKVLSIVKDKPDLNSFKIKGILMGRLDYRPFSDDKKKMDYHLSTALQISYKDFIIPFNYTFSNGKSIIGINKPNLRIPKFKNWGFSPTYKWAKVHIGDRQLQFSKYTYNNLRFKGLGMELEPKSFSLKFFKGRLNNNSLQDYNYQGIKDYIYPRKAIATKIGYNGQKQKFHFLLFKSTDEFSRTSLNTILPKANSILGLNSENEISYFKISNEYAVSGYTPDETSEIVNIKTGDTFYNMLGLFKKRTTSKYGYAINSSISTQINKSINLALNYEKISSNYYSLGLAFLQRGFEYVSVSSNIAIGKKFSSNIQLGNRKQLVTNIENTEQSDFVGSIKLNYNLSPRTRFNLLVSNKNDVQRSTYRNVQYIETDSVFLSLTKKNISGSALVFLNDKKTNSIMISGNHIISNSIDQHENEITQREVKTTSFGINYNNTNDKRTIDINSNLSNTTGFENPMISYNLGISHKWRIDDSFNLESGINGTTSSSNKGIFSNIQLSSGINYMLNERTNFNFITRTVFTNSSTTKLNLKDNLNTLTFKYNL